MKSPVKCGDQKKQPDVAVRASTTKGKTMSKGITNKVAKQQKKGKDGSVTRSARRMKMKREYFQTLPIECGISPDKTRAVIQLIATFVILVAQATMNSELGDTPGPLVRCKEGIPVRVLDLDKSILSADEVLFPGGIFLDQRPNWNDKLFFIIQPLGQGGNGVCCLAANCTGQVCVIKFLHAAEGPNATADDLKELAEKEEKNWKDVYETWYSNPLNPYPDRQFVESHKLGHRVFLFLPFFRVPVDLHDRKKLISEQNNLLRKGLVFFASKNKIHNDLKWRHIGVPPKASEDANMVVLLDLGEGVEHCVDKAKLNKWVDDSYTSLVERMKYPSEDVTGTHAAVEKTAEEQSVTMVVSQPAS
jgi:hypothetical protein